MSWGEWAKQGLHPPPQSCEPQTKGKKVLCKQGRFDNIRDDKDDVMMKPAMLFAIFPIPYLVA